MNTNEENVLTNPTQPQSTTSSKQSLIDFYRNGMSLSKLTDGQYQATLQAHTLVEPTLPDAKPYIRLELKLSDRVIIDNRFDQGFQIALDHVKQQLGISDQTIPVSELLESLKETEFTIWVSYAVINNNTYRNISYLAPRETTNTTPANTETIMEGKDF